MQSVSFQSTLLSWRSDVRKIIPSELHSCREPGPRCVRERSTGQYLANHSSSVRRDAGRLKNLAEENTRTWVKVLALKGAPLMVRGNPHWQWA